MRGKPPEEHALQITEKAFHTNEAGILKTTIVTKYWLNKNNNNPQEQLKKNPSNKTTHKIIVLPFQSSNKLMPIFFLPANIVIWFNIQVSDRSATRYQTVDRLIPPAINNYSFDHRYQHVAKSVTKATAQISVLSMF